MPYIVPRLDDFWATALDKGVGELRDALRDEAQAAKRTLDAKGFRDRWMARRNGIATQVNERWLKAAPASAKREVGKRVNEIRAKIEGTVEEVARTVEALAAHAQYAATTGKDTGGAVLEDVELHKLAAQRLDITLPAIRPPIAPDHPAIKPMNQLVAVFRNLGYSVDEGPEIETDYYNFEALNFPPNHPARDTQDTLFIAGQESKPLPARLLLRTRTSPAH